jgi:hypothetical protein
MAQDHHDISSIKEEYHIYTYISHIMHILYAPMHGQVVDINAFQASYEHTRRRETNLIFHVTTTRRAVT